jgi:hypothetical protein
MDRDGVARAPDLVGFTGIRINLSLFKFRRDL